MSETRSKRDTLGAEVRNNTPLLTMYVVGIIGVAVGLILMFVGIGSASSVDPSGALAWEFWGGGLITFGALLLIGGAIAHAVNWQIVNR